MIPNVIKASKKKGYTVFEQDDKPFNLNIIGVRADDATTNVFNDRLHICWKYKGKWTDFNFPVTCDSGLYWLNNPLSKLGTAIAATTFLSGAFDRKPQDIYTPTYNVGYAEFAKQRPKFSYIDPTTGVEKPYDDIFIPEANQPAGQMMLGPYALAKTTRFVDFFPDTIHFPSSEFSSDIVLSSTQHQATTSTPVLT